MHIWRDGDRIVERAGTNVAQLAPTVFAEHRDLAALAAKNPLRVTIVAGNLGWLRRFPEHLHTIGLDSRLITNALPVWRWQFRRWQQEDFAVDLEWIVAEDGPARERLVQATRRALEDLQSAVVEHTRQPWPANPRSGRLDRPEAHAEIVGDDVNPMLRLWYGDRDNSTLEVTPRPIYLTSVIHSLR